MNKRRGRPRADTGARARILTAARIRFAEHGYARTSLRAIARDVDVDHALISYYFRSKEGLFQAVAELALSPARVFDAVSGRADREHFAQALLETALAAWDSPDYQQGLWHLIGESVSSPAVQRTFREYLESEMVGRLADLVGGASARQRAAVAASLIAGLYFTRYVLKVEPVASMSSREVVATHAPAVDAVLRSAQSDAMRRSRAR